jgi:ABC-type polysaccharide/polyol phosphate transport system ATPase subunit
MPENAIEVRGVGKRYKLGHQSAGYATVRDSLTAALRPRRGRAEPPDEVWALRDVDLTIHESEAVGIVGTNGAGKSTLLRILARITEPSVGVTRTRGRVGVMLEVGTGFHPELTGRENVFLSGAVMGMSRGDIRRRFDEIVAFAGVEPFLETPLKRYSSGMQLRLAFAVAAHLEPELMLVDEILAVGDVEFQRRCLQRMRRLSEEGRTVVFVSHDLGAVTRLCTRAVWAEHGRIVRDGDATEVVQAYYAKALGQAGQVELPVDGDVGVSHVAITNDTGAVLRQPRRDESLWVALQLVANRAVPDVDLGLYLVATDGSVLLHETWSDQPHLPELLPESGRYVVRLRIPPMLRAGDYTLGLWLGSDHESFVDREVLSFSLMPLPDDRREAIGRRRAVQPAVDWSSARVDLPQG